MSESNYQNGNKSRPDVAAPSLSPPALVSFKRAQSWLRDADLLLVRAPGVVAWLGRGLHRHAATVARWGNDWFALETRPGGGRAVPVSAFVERRPNRVDVFRPNPDGRWKEYRPELALAFMRRAVSLRYGWASVCKAALTRVPFVRSFLDEGFFNDDALREFPQEFGVDELDSQRREQNGLPDFFRVQDRAPETLDSHWNAWKKIFRNTTLHCSEARALADRYAGADPVPFLNDRFVEPADLARSPFYRYQFTFERLED